ncbi:LPXTG cell wall anchor domain-containing protein, partial [Aerococcaceae bacterium zg-A91]|nr:LPXTG cell wall anchor domain-containing protein [Aerococcaceae bacterium zg-A91]
EEPTPGEPEGEEPKPEEPTPSEPEGEEPKPEEPKPSEPGQSTPKDPIENDSIVQQSAVLPNTGEATSMITWSAAALSILAGLGFVVTGRKEDEEDEA